MLGCITLRGSGILFLRTLVTSEEGVLTPSSLSLAISNNISTDCVIPAGEFELGNYERFYAEIMVGLIKV